VTGSTEFFATAAVGCGRTTSTTISFNAKFFVEVDTGVGMGAGDTSNRGDAFRISYELTPANPAITLTQVQINLRNDGLGVGVFHPGSSTFAGNEAAGNGPTVHASSDVPSGDVSFSFNGGFTVMTIDVTAGSWAEGDDLIFGVDTDRVRVNGPNMGEPPISTTDRGGDFGATGGASCQNAADEVLFSFAFDTPIGMTNLGDLDFRLQRTSAGRANLQGCSQNFDFTVTVVVPDVDFAVLTQKTVPVTPLCTQIFGIPLGTPNVSGRAIATARCVGGNSFLVQNPQAVHFTAVNCP
jgi:hypothetical protein